MPMRRCSTLLTEFAVLEQDEMVRTAEELRAI